MGKNCIYCKIALDENAVIDVCQRCGIGVWGEKMFAAIVQNMSNAKESGDLYQGSVSTEKSSSESKRQPSTSDQATQQTTSAGKNVLQSMAQEAIEFQEKHPKEDPTMDTPALPTITNTQTQEILSAENEISLPNKGNW